MSKYRRTYQCCLRLVMRYHVSIESDPISPENSSPVNDKPGFVYVHECHITRTKPATASRADLASNTARAFDHPLNRRCCLEFFVELVFKILNPGFVSLKEMISHNRWGCFLSDAQYSCTSCLISQNQRLGLVLRNNNHKNPPALPAYTRRRTPSLISSGRRAALLRMPSPWYRNASLTFKLHASNVLDGSAPSAAFVFGSFNHVSVQPISL
jgi:hypothetical protein